MKIFLIFLFLSGTSLAGGIHQKGLSCAAFLMNGRNYSADSDTQETFHAFRGFYTKLLGQSSEDQLKVISGIRERLKSSVFSSKNQLIFGHRVKGKEEIEDYLYNLREIRDSLSGKFNRKNSSTEIKASMFWAFDFWFFSLFTGDVSYLHSLAVYSAISSPIVVRAVQRSYALKEQVQTFGLDILEALDSKTSFYKGYTYKNFPASFAESKNNTEMMTSISTQLERVLSYDLDKLGFYQHKIKEKLFKMPLPQWRNIYIDYALDMSEPDNPELFMFARVSKDRNDTRESKD